MKRVSLLSEIVRNNYTELSQDAQGLLKGGFGSVIATERLVGEVQNNCVCNGNNCNCPTSYADGVYNNCACGDNNCNCTTTGRPTSPTSIGAPSGLLSL